MNPPTTTETTQNHISLQQQGHNPQTVQNQGQYGGQQYPPHQNFAYQQYIQPNGQTYMVNAQGQYVSYPPQGGYYPQQVQPQNQDAYNAQYQNTNQTNSFQQHPQQHPQHNQQYIDQQHQHPQQHHQPYQQYNNQYQEEGAQEVVEEERESSEDNDKFNGIVNEAINEEEGVAVEDITNPTPTLTPPPQDRDETTDNIIEDGTPQEEKVEGMKESEEKEEIKSSEEEGSFPSRRSSEDRGEFKGSSKDNDDPWTRGKTRRLVYSRDELLKMWTKHITPPTSDEAANTDDQITTTLLSRQITEDGSIAKTTLGVLSGYPASYVFIKHPEMDSLKLVKRKEIDPMFLNKNEDNYYGVGSDEMQGMMNEMTESERIVREAGLIFNKISSSNYHKLSGQFAQLRFETSFETLYNVVIEMIKKVQLQGHFSSVFSELCSDMHVKRWIRRDPPPPLIQDDRMDMEGGAQEEMLDIARQCEEDEYDSLSAVFHKILLSILPSRFSAHDSRAEKMISCQETEEERDEMITIMKHEFFGLCQFIADLAANGMLKKKYVFVACGHLLDEANVNEVKIESCVKMIESTGKKMEEKEKDAKALDEQFTRLQELIDEGRFSTRCRFMMEDLITLRANKWRKETTTSSSRGRNSGTQRGNRNSPRNNKKRTPNDNSSSKYRGNQGTSSKDRGRGGNSKNNSADEEEGWEVQGSRKKNGGGRKTNNSKKDGSPSF